MKAPKHLRKAGKKHWQQIINEFEINDSGGASILQVACESLDRLTEIREAIDKEGVTQLDRFSQTRPHPLLAEEHKAKVAFLSAMKNLNLDITPENNFIGRPPGNSKKV